MLKRSSKPKELVQFSERYGTVCAAACRQNAIIDQARRRTLLRGWKLA